jgi:hypothetical protein
MTSILTAVEVVARSLSRSRGLRALLRASGAMAGLSLLALLLRVRWPLLSSYWWLVGAAGAWLFVAVRGWYLRSSASAVRMLPGSDAVDAALWMEQLVEQRTGVPRSFALVTLVEMTRAHDVSTPSPALVQSAGAVVQQLPLAEVLGRHRWQQCRGALAFVLGAMGLLVWMVWIAPGASPSSAGDDVNATGSPGPGAARVGSAEASLDGWTVEVEPPRYRGAPAHRYGDVGTVVAVEGSRLRVRGTGAPPQLARALTPSASSVRESPDAYPPVVIARPNGWEAQLIATAAPVPYRLRRGATTRLFVIEGHPDTIPRVVLEAPLRDSVLRAPTGRVALRATIRDDAGLKAAAFELLISSGEGERFTVRTQRLAAVTWPVRPNHPTDTLTVAMDLSALGLGPGDVMHMRAIARDHHPAANRELGSSDTRAFRIARPSEYDSVAVEPAPPPAVDSSLLSQRMLLLLTERLDRQQRRMTRTEVVRESQRLARDQARLRLAVGDVVFQRLSGESSAEHAHFAGDGHEHGVEQQGGKLAMTGGSSNRDATGTLDEGNDSPVVAINQPLLEAYNAMWDAGRALEQGDPHAAIPPMRRALVAIEKSRAASRLYLRGRPPQVIVDLAKVRLTGRDTGQSTTRGAPIRPPLAMVGRDARLMQAARLSMRDVGAARDSLLLLRLEALTDAPAFAAAVQAVVERLTAGGDATEAFQRARWVLGGVTRLGGTRWTDGSVR